MPITTEKPKRQEILIELPATVDGITHVFKDTTPTPKLNTNLTVFVNETSTARDEFVKDKAVIDLGQIDPKVNVSLKKYGPNEGKKANSLAIVLDDPEKNSTTEFLFPEHFSGKGSGEGIEEIAVEGYSNARRKNIDGGLEELVFTMDLNVQKKGDRGIAHTSEKKGFEEIRQLFEKALSNIDREASRAIGKMVEESKQQAPQTTPKPPTELPAKPASPSKSPTPSP